MSDLIQFDWYLCKKMKFGCTKIGTKDPHPERKGWGHSEEDICNGKQTGPREKPPLPTTWSWTCEEIHFCCWCFVRAALQTNTDGNVYWLLAETEYKQTNGKKQCFLIMQLIKFYKLQDTGLQVSQTCSSLQVPHLKALSGE